MPHKCVRCSKVYSDGSNELLKGCSCGGRFFFYIRKEHLEQVEKITKNLTETQKDFVEKDVKAIIGKEYDEEKPIILDLESINILEPGKYEIDLIDLFKKAPLVYKLGEGKYIIDIESTFDSMKKKEKE